VDIPRGRATRPSQGALRGTSTTPSALRPRTGSPGSRG